MAKMIKCPTCGTQIEVPPQAGGQIVKCPGCGKGLKLVAKPKPGGAAAGQAAGAPSPGGSVAGGSFSALTFTGEPPPQERGPLDDLPSLDSNCAVCGSATDPDQLVEDNGRLVCPDCIKGARSAMARPEGGAALLDFAPAQLPARRGKLITVTPSLVVGGIAALVFVVCSLLMHLEVVKKPVGTRADRQPPPANGTRATPVGPAAVDPDTGEVLAPSDVGTAPPPTAVTPPDNAVAVAPTAPEDGGPVAPPPTGPVDPAAVTPDPGTPDAAAPDPATTGPTEVALAPGDAGSIFNDPDASATPRTPGGAAPPVAPPPEAAPVVVDPADPAPPEPPAFTSDDPLDRGMERLIARDYTKAVQEFDRARLRYVVSKLPPPSQPLAPQQQATLEGLAAAYIGRGAYDAARGPLDLCYGRNVRTRSVMLNLAIYTLNTPRPIKDLLIVADATKNFMSGHAGDETAAEIFGTLVNKIASIDRAPREKVDAYWTFLDQYVDQIAQQGGAANPNAGKLKWGLDWLPAEEVRQLRLTRGVEDRGGVLAAAAKEAETAFQRAKLAEAALQKAKDARAKGQPADLVGAQNQLDAANAVLAEAQKKLQAAGAGLNFKKPRWLTKFEPVLPTQQPVGLH